MTFQIKALPADEFTALFSLDDTELKRRRARREIVQSSPGTPCRVSLEDAAVGEEVILLNYEHQDGDTPFQASHAIYIRKDARQAAPDIDEVPALFRTRLVSIRGFDESHMMVDADAVDGTVLEGAIDKMFASPAVEYIHLHNAKLGCFTAKAVRA